MVLGFGLSSIFSKAGKGSYIDFLAPGIIAQTILFVAIFSGVELIWDRQFGFLKETLVAPVSRFEIMLGRTLGGATIAAAQGIIALLISIALGFRPSIYAIPLALLIMFIIALLFTALGTGIASMLHDFQGFQLIMNFLVMPLFFLSGAIFPLEEAPAFLKAASMIDPLTYGVDGLRGALSGSSHFGILLDIAVVGILSIITLFIGSILFERIQA